MRFCLTLVFFGFSAGAVWSQTFQDRFEMGPMGGATYYIVDLNPTGHFIYSKPAGGAIIRINMTTRWSFRFTGSYGNVWANDNLSQDSYQQNRNLNFSSSLLEIAGGFEINMFKYMINNMKYPITPYFFYEMAYFRIDPMGTIDGVEFQLQPLGTEGQGTPLNDKRKYGLSQMSIPLGVGVKFNIVPRLAMSLEYGIRKTFTDYLDDVSGNYVDNDQLTSYSGPLAASLSDPSLSGIGTSNPGFNRGNPATKDWYVFYGAMITFKPFKRSMCEFQQRF